MQRKTMQQRSRPTDDTLILVLGDYHMRKVKQVIELSASPKLSQYGNMSWECSNWMKIKSAKKEYFKFKKAFGPPSVVFLSVGNNDLTKVSTPKCIISSLLRTATAFYKSGTRVVVIFSLVERQIVGKYNAQVNQINGIINSYAQKIEWLHFFVTLNTKLYSATEIYSTNGRELLAKPLETIIDNMKSLLEEDNFRELMQKENPYTLGPQNDTLVRPGTSARDSIFKSEVNLMKLKLNAMMQEKSKSDERSAKLDRTISALGEYVGKLEALGK